jgi:hypothetical protein
MHLEGPWLSTTGKRKGKKKFASAEHARRARELDESWKELQKKWANELDDKRRARAMAAPTLNPVVNKPYIRDTGPKIQSLPFTGGPCTKAPEKVYTGTKVKGIGTMHKSNAVPIFSDEEAVDISKMRR